MSKQEVVKVCNEMSRRQLGGLIASINREINSDDEPFDRKGSALVELYEKNPAVVDGVLVSLCGWNMESLLAKAGVRTW